jgi:hypothetical protein
MHRLILHAFKLVLGTLPLVAMNAAQAFPQQYYAEAPTPPSVPTYKSSQFMISAVDGTDFYGVSPYYSQQTTDGNLFVSSIIISQNRFRTMATYVQIDCGRRIFRDLVPWYEVSRYGYERFQNPTTYNWTYFNQNSAFEQVGKALCTSAALDRRASD